VSKFNILAHRLLCLTLEIEVIVTSISRM